MELHALADGGEVAPERKKERHKAIALWTRVKDNDSLHYGDGTIGHGLTMDIVKGLYIREWTCFACIAHIDHRGF